MHFVKSTSSCNFLTAVCLCACSAPSAMPVTSQLLRGLPRTTVLASSLLPCQQHQSQLRPITHQPASRQPTRTWQSHQHSRSYQTTSVLRSYILTPPQVNSILKANEYSFKVCVGSFMHTDNTYWHRFMLVFIPFCVVFLGARV